MLTTLLFVLFGGLAVGCAVSLVAQRNPLYCAISLVGVFVALACLYVMLAAPFIAAVQVIVYAGAIMVLVVFVIMLLNVEEEVRRPVRLRFLIPAAVAMAALLIAEAAFMLYFVGASRLTPADATRSGVGLTASIGTGLFTEYLLPFEATSVLILMALVGAMTLARRVAPPRLQTVGAAVADLGLVAEAAAPQKVIQPGRTEATGQAMAELQIERGEAAAPSPKTEESE